MRGVVFAALLIIPATNSLAQSTAAVAQYRVVHDWPKIPENEMLDEVSAVAVAAGSKVLVLTRAGRKWPDNGQLDTTLIEKPTIWIFDGNTGNLLGRLGANLFALPHSITVDAAGNIWVADVALHQVFKLSSRGELLLKLGERGVAGEDDRHFNRPSDAAIGPDGSIYVSDGYGNNRVVKFDSAGRFVRAWGKKGTGPGEFNLPHAIATDPRGRVFVNDRGNSRIECFDGEGRFLFEWKGPPFVNPQDMKIGPTGRAFVVQSGNEAPPDEAGVLVLENNGSVSERVGRFGNYDGQFVDPHWVAVDQDENIYVADFAGRRIEKFTRR